MFVNSKHHHPLVTLLTDFGMQDGYVGVMKAVMLGIASNLHFIDLTHEIEPQNVASAAWVLATSYRYFPAGSIFLCVVDPGVGSQRRPVALHCGEWYFVGPDNGLWTYLLNEQPLHQAVALTNDRYHLPQVSSTFQGRDLFAPVAAHLAQGVSLSELGTPLAPEHLLRLALPTAQRHGSIITAGLVYIDHFGNIITSIPAALVPEFFSCSQVLLQLDQPGRATIIPPISARRRFFAASNDHDQQQPFLYLDSAGYIAIAIQNGNAAKTLDMAIGDPVTLTLTLT